MVFSATVLVVLLSVLTINVLVDPLWNGKGNRLTGQNYPFNERLSRTNLFFQTPDKFDCLVFGSSRVTLMDVGRLRGKRCFNFAFSDATPAEMLAYARYLHHKGIQPGLVIIGVDGRNFSRRKLHRKVPDFIDSLTDPPAALVNDFSLDVLLFSLRTLAGDAPRPRFYTRNFVGDVLPGTPPFKPRTCFGPEGRGRSYSVRRVHFYQDICKQFGHASCVGYAPPLSAWDVTTLYADGTLENYLQTLYRVARSFDRFYDFTIPSDITRNPSNSYDGQHFFPRINDRVAETIRSDRIQGDFGIPLHRTDFQEYRNRYFSAVQQFYAQIGSGIRWSYQCGLRSVVR